MNSSENAYTCALFFTLISLGAILRIEDISGLAIGAGSAILAAISLRQALVKSAQAKEEDHQRMEVQFQQLRSKILETSSANVTAMNSLNEVTQLLKENLKILREQSTDLDSLIAFTKNAESINSAVVGLEENFFALNTSMEKIFLAIQAQEKISDSMEFKKLVALAETNKINLQTALKIIHVISQTIKTPLYATELEKIDSSIGTLASALNKLSKNLSAIFTQFNPKAAAVDSLKISADEANKNLSELVRINGTLSRSFTTTLDDLRLDMAKLSARLEELNTLINKNRVAALTQEDINLLKKLATKSDLK